MAKFATITFFPIVLWCFYFTTTPSNCLTNQTDLLPLMAFKGAIKQDPLGALSSWNDTSHYCHWHGILCSHKHRDRVVALNLMSQGIVGSLSPHIGNLSFLKTVNLKNNSLTGEIPQTLGGLFRVQRLDFSNNSFSGEVPKNISNCANLYYLNLVDNSLTGNFPDWLGSLPKLETLGLGKNRLVGSIPHSIGNLSSLKVFSLIRCGLHGEIPQEMAQLHGLTYLDLGENNLSGKIPSGLYNISSIEYFSVTINQLHGTIPPYIGYTLTNLKYLHFGNNLFTGSFPNSLSNATKLSFIAFNSNFFTGRMPKNLGNLLGLEVVFFYKNQIQDDLSFISSLANCSSLEIIFVGHNLLKGSLPESIANLSAYSIAIDDGQLHGNIPSGIGNLPNVMVLSFDLNYLTGPIPPAIGKLTKLEELYLGANKLTGELPSSLGNLTLLRVLSLDRNNISGSIPASLGKCTNLILLDICTNNLSGSIPREVLSLSSIAISFNLSHNGLSGFLEPEVGNLGNLVEFDVSNNRLSGLIPNSLSKCSSLEWLHLDHNSFEGEIPQGLIELRGLRVLDLSSNNLSGSIPSFLGDLLLENLNLSFNTLHGEVPTQGVFRNASATSIEGNKDLCGDIVGLKLLPCPSPNSKNDKMSRVLKVLIPILVAVACLTLLLCFFIFLHRLRVSSKTRAILPSFTNWFVRVSYADLLKATNGFSEANLIGLGSYGSVYKGILHHGETAVAVKVLNLEHKGASTSFMSECFTLKSIRHRNVLKIFSACSSVDFQGNEFKALVYEFMANGSLENWLYQDGDGDGDEFKNLELIQRLNIAIDIAYALEHLHNGCDCTIVHGDLKPSNVLFDDEMTAKIGDFGLAEVISEISSEHQNNSVAVKGTIGYVAPEYGMGGMVSTQADVYSYGILVLEIFTSRKPTDDAFNDNLSLRTFVENALPDQVLEIVDPRILLEHNMQSRIKDCIVSVLKIGVSCSVESPRDRMKMEDVINELHKVKNVYEKEEL